MEKQKFCSEFGDCVRRARNNAGLSQEALADLCGIDRSYIGGVERGERNPTLTVVCKIANGLNLSLSELFSDFETTNTEA